MYTTDKRLVILDETDNVLVCCGRINEAERVQIEGKFVTLDVSIDIGHKIARADLDTGVKVIKYGVPIGSTTQPVKFGQHVHLQNMKSDYIASHTRSSQKGEY
ncbi:UxaA family hydrolase [Alteromonas sp. 14N.309.X.WAT.G.H12]|uniref:UxaA family hydrolase n=1 Tax=Alteromonas sp. 14N.309.X.WAT.G.H12 TaxID=3120824 RepID=UPI002FD0647D